MRTVWKFALDVHFDEQTFDMPAGALSLAVQIQHGKPALWTAVDTEQPRVKRRFKFVGTNRELDADWSEYVGTAQLEDATADEALEWLCWVTDRPRSSSVKDLLRLAARKAHPDVGGDSADWDRVDAARQLLERAGAAS